MFWKQARTLLKCGDPRVSDRLPLQTEAVLTNSGIGNTFPRTSGTLAAVQKLLFTNKCWSLWKESCFEKIYACNQKLGS